MAQRAWTAFGVGRELEAAWVSACASATPPPPATRVLDVPVPEGVNPSKLGTWVQRAALDPASLQEVPEELVGPVQQAAAHLGEAGVALGICMAGTPAGDKMKAKLGSGDPGEEAFLLFGVHDPDLGAPLGGEPAVS